MRNPATAVSKTCCLALCLGWSHLGSQAIHKVVQIVIADAYLVAARHGTQLLNKGQHWCL